METIGPYPTDKRLPSVKESLEYMKSMYAERDRKGLTYEQKVMHVLGDELEQVIREKQQVERKADKNIEIASKRAPVVHGAIYLIYETWIDPFENRIAFGKEVKGYVLTIEEAKTIKRSGRVYTHNDCWQIPEGMPITQFTYQAVKRF